MPLKTGFIETYDYSQLVKSIQQDNLQAILFFYSIDYDGAKISSTLKSAFPGANILGCSMIGGYNDQKPLKNGITAISFAGDVVEKSFITMNTGFRANPEQVSEQFVKDIERTLADESILPGQYLGILLIDGLGLAEILMKKLSVASKISFPIVGGSAADELTFTGTKIAANGQESDEAIAILILKMNVPFYYNHFVHYESTGKSVVVTKADPKNRIAWEFDGKPAAEVYGELIGKENLETIGSEDFSLNPLGIIIGDKIYTRSPAKILESKGIQFYCWLEVGNELELLEKGDIIANADLAMKQANSYLDNQIQEGLLFNCVLRYLELEKDNLLESFNNIFNSFPCIGFNTYGEELFTHHNQTLTAVFFGQNGQEGSNK